MPLIVNFPQLKQFKIIDLGVMCGSLATKGPKA
jgi:hypothetical protein